MKIITLHCDYIKFKAIKKAIKNPEKIESKEETEIKEVLVVLTAIEKGDGQEELKRLVESVKKTANEVGANNIVLYPYAHLSSSLSNPDIALNLLKKAEVMLKKDFNVQRAPFGYYKSFELKCKGHPLSELSKEFKSSKNEKDNVEYNTKQLLKEISRSKLDTSKLKKNDHRIFGQKLDLFSFNDSAPGSVFWHNNGVIVFNELKEFIRRILRKFNYLEIITPQILDNKLFKISGHWSNYSENMFLTKYESRDFGIKPMNCPPGMLIYKTKTRSYKDLPLRLSEFGVDHRKELSGVLAGLFRLVQFTQDDAHIFCTKNQIKSEIEGIFKILKIIYKDSFNFEYFFELSTRPKKFMGDINDWDYSEKVLEEVLKKSKVKYNINKGDGAFYGPKIDVHIKDSLNRPWQCATIQLDMQMPKRFNINYIDKDNKEKTPFVIHRALLGSLERFIGILLEHLDGNLPIWLSPIQIKVLSFTDRNVDSSKKIISRIISELPNVRIDSDFRPTTINEKIRDSEIKRIPYTIVIGDKEEKSDRIALRERGKKPKFGVKIERFIENIKEELSKPYLL